MRNVAPDLEFDRALATIGLLRHVTDAVPLDAVCVYTNQTKHPYGIRRFTDRLGYCSYYCQERHQFTVDDEKEQSAPIVVPNSLIKMTKDYIVRAFWDQINHLRSSDIICLDCQVGQSGGNSMREVLRTFPKSVLNTISGIKISSYASLWDSKNAIEALHAACVPDSFDAAFCPDANRTADIMRIEHRRNISQLLSVLNNYSWNANNRNNIPNEAEKKLLLDLIESLTIMFGGFEGYRNGFFGNVERKKLYEFALKTDKLDRNRQTHVLTCRGDAFDTRVGGSWNHAYTNKYTEDTRHMSPEAAICLQTFAFEPNDPRVTMFIPNPVELKKLRPQPLNEVAIYLRNEANLAWVKAKHISEELERRKHYYDECCEAPCEPCEAC